MLLEETGCKKRTAVGFTNLWLYSLKICYRVTKNHVYLLSIVIRIYKPVHLWIIAQSPYSDCWGISLMHILHKHCTNLSKIRCKHTVVTSNPWWKCALNVGIHQPIDPCPHSTESQGAPPHVRCQRGSSHSSLCANMTCVFFFLKACFKTKHVPTSFLLGEEIGEETN